MFHNVLPRQGLRWGFWDFLGSPMQFLPFFRQFYATFKDYSERHAIRSERIRESIPGQRLPMQG